MVIPRVSREEPSSDVPAPWAALPFEIRSPKLLPVTRHVVGLLVVLAVLHVNVVRADIACGMHDAAPSTGHEGMQHGTELPADDGSCDEPAMSDCCQAVLSCAPALEPGEASAASRTTRIPHRTIATAVGQRPASRSTAPEPPPPKA